MIRLKNGDIVEWRRTESQDSEPYEVVASDEDTTTLLAFDGSPEVCLTNNELNQEYLAARMMLSTANRDTGVSDRYAFVMLPARDRQAARRREDYVREVDDRVSDNGRIANGALDQALANVAAKHCETKIPGYGAGAPSRATARRWYALWTHAGRVIDALVPQTARRGASSGRLDPRIETVIQQVIQSEYLTMNQNDVPTCYRALTTAVEELNKYREPHNQLKRPSQRAFRRRIERIDPYIRDLKRRGPEYAKSKQKIVKRGQRRATRPNEIWEVDATCMDVMLIDLHADLLGEKVRWKRAYLTLIIDQFTRCIVGYYLRFEKPSFESIAAALRMAIMSKDEIVARYPELKNDWPVEGRPAVLVCDNGRENHAEALRYLCGILGIELLYVPRKSPQGKPHVERVLRTINRASHTLPGTTFSNPKERGEYDSKKHAGLTIDDLEKWFVRHIVDVYHQDLHEALFKSPYHMWLDNIQDVVTAPPAQVVEEQAFFMKEAKRTLHKDGVHMDHLVYHSDEFQFMFDHQKKQNVDVRYSEDVLDKILVADPQRKRWVTAYCNNMPKYAVGRSRRAHNAIVADAIRDGKGRIDERAIAKAAMSNLEDARRRARKGRRQAQKQERAAGSARSKRGKVAESTSLTSRHHEKSLVPAGADLFEDDWTSHADFPNSKNQ
ncbi:DDE-type integrase/transposase/recombinase [Pelagibius sp. 7325]|uniref:Mu transposase C-terminal domain-containing protein n=1 Tax=Pelagibius sp. 7325 TaxID=3131994 RepID=UPI0030ED38EB